MFRRSIVALFAVLVILAGVFVVTPPASASATGSANIVPSPNAGGKKNEIKSVSCVSSTFCMAVGVFDDGTTGLM